MSSRWLRIFTPWSGSCILTTTRSIWAKGNLRGCPGWPPPTPDPDSTDLAGMPGSVCSEINPHRWWDFRLRSQRSAGAGRKRGPPAPAPGVSVAQPRPTQYHRYQARAHTRARAKSALACISIHSSPAPLGLDAGKSQNDRTPTQHPPCSGAASAHRGAGRRPWLRARLAGYWRPSRPAPPCPAPCPS